MSIAYESNNDFSFDTEIFHKASRAFQKDADSLSEIDKNLVQKIKNLKEIGWKSEAGEKFFDKIDSHWSKDIKRYADLMNDLAVIINYASKQFDTISEQAKYIKYQEDLIKLTEEVVTEKFGADSLRNLY
ncbi:WXG100 family type VII secretion target [Anaeromicropila herbilytica]|uniref:WXG100 family type VII secretion target n=1 Tax=Anaeromicropila herbilytica TaxID=2785025 RepID=A0A7R7ENZ3_9FIRM|nr:WXG100 family type VII secretion target [Anaeromicropila herbilytica]BCN32349.1 hypothetical protein bsdtb5_36440 [Anaeromicropila herbilytica]